MQEMIKFVCFLSAIFLLYATLAWSNFGMWACSNPEEGRLAGKMRVVMLAISNYACTNGHLPPAQILDEQGNPMHSWRVLLLPFLEQQELFEKYDMDQPWNSSHNLAVANELDVAIFGQDNPTQAIFKFTCGPETCFQGNTQRKLIDISNNPIVLVGDRQEPILWTQPEDIDFENVMQRFQKNHGNQSEKPTWVACLDGQRFRVRRLKDPSPIEEHFLVNQQPTTSLDQYHVSAE